jgi:hypothetical protein
LVVIWKNLLRLFLLAIPSHPNQPAFTPPPPPPRLEQKWFETGL